MNGLMATIGRGVRVNNNWEVRDIGEIGVVRTTYYFEIRCNACRINVRKGNRLEASVAMINHLLDKHDKEDWRNCIDAQIIQMYWDSPSAGHSVCSADEIMQFLAILAQDQDIPYEYWLRFNNRFERNGV